MTSTPGATSDRAQDTAAPRNRNGNAATKRKPAAERRAEIVGAAALIALDQGLHAVTLAGVAEALGVRPGLVHHYFRTVDALVAAGFGHASERERIDLFTQARRASDTPLGQARTLVAALVDEERDEVSLLWLDAWQASRHRPALRDEVVRQMLAWQTQLAALVSAGVDVGDFVCAAPSATAQRILALVDGLSVQAALRDSVIDSAGVHELVLTAAERELGLAPGELHP